MTSCQRPVVVEAFLDPKTSSEVVTLLHRCASGDVEVAMRRFVNRVELSYRDVVQIKDPAVLSITKAREMCLQHVAYSCGIPVYPEFSLCTVSYSGAQHVLHADNKRFDQATGHWLPNHTPQRDHSAVLYFSGSGRDFAGGDIEFPQHQLSIPPSEGMLVHFPSSEDFLHQVTVITSGVRISMAIWFTHQRSLMEDA